MSFVTANIELADDDQLRRWGKWMGIRDAMTMRRDILEDEIYAILEIESYFSVTNRQPRDR